MYYVLAVVGPGLIGLCLPKESCGLRALIELGVKIYMKTGLLTIFVEPETMQPTHLDTGAIVVIVVLVIMGLLSIVGIIVQMTSLGDKYQPGPAAQMRGEVDVAPDLARPS